MHPLSLLDLGLTGCQESVYFVDQLHFESPFMIRRILPFLFTLLFSGNFLLLAGQSPMAHRSILSSNQWFVKANASGSANGSSWTNAFTNLTQALAVAVSGDTIRVAKGMYRPAPGKFTLKDSVVILGGYPDTGNPTDSDRHPGLYPSMLSGETGNLSILFDNLPNIIIGTNLHLETVLDGFIVESGFANNTLSGVGLQLVNSSIVIKQCVFRNNSSFNTAQGGSSIYCNNSSPIVDRCFFTNNKDLGYSTIDSRNGSQPRFSNCVFFRNDGRNVVYAQSSNCFLQHCSFVNNQIGVAPIPVQARASYVFAENGSNVQVRNSLFFGNRYNSSADSVDVASLNATVLVEHSITQVYNSGTQLLVNIDPRLLDSNAVAGNDQLFFTADDGLSLNSCSPAINKGNNTFATATDLLNLNRIANGITDLGAYEYQQGTGDVLLQVPNDSLVANREFTDANGWTNYYQDCQLLFSVKKNGQIIGTVNVGNFRAVLSNNAAYGTGSATDLSHAAYVTPGVQWKAMNRSWRLVTTFPIADSMLVRFPFSNTDVNDIKGSFPAIQQPDELVLYATDPGYAPNSLAIPVYNFRSYYPSTTATAQSWVYSSIDTVNYATFYIKKAGGGGAGYGTGFRKGPIAAINDGCAYSNRSFAAAATGNSYQWQVDTGSGFANINNDAIVNGAQTTTLLLISPPTNWYGFRFRCLVDGVLPANRLSDFEVLRFSARWNGSGSNAWDESENWDCGVLPDENTDVFIEGTFPNNPLVSSDVLCRSIRIAGGAGIQIIAPAKLELTGK